MKKASEYFPEFFSIFLTFLILSFMSHTAEACTQKFNRSNDLTNFTKVCFMKAGFKEVPSYDDMKASSFDDKCAAKCIFGGFDLIDDQGHLDRDGVMDLLEENASKQLLLKLTEIATSCAETAETDKVKGTKTGTTSQECMPVQKFYTCFVSAADKLC